MSILAQPTPADKYRTVTMRVDRQTRVARFEGLQSLYFGDRLIVVVDNVSGIDPTKVQLLLWEKEASPAFQDCLALGEDFAFVTGSTSRIYQEIELNSENLKNALAASPVGTPVDFRLILRDDGMPFVDQDCPVYPNPEVDVAPIPPATDIVANPYVRRSHLRQWALDALNPVHANYLPLDTQDDMAAAITEILTKLSDVTA